MNFGDGESPDRRILAGLPEPRRVLLANVPARLVLKPVVRAREHCPALVPDDLLVVQEADAQQAIKNLASELRSVPDVRHLETRNQREGFGPIGARVTGDRRLRVAFSALLHIARFSGPMAVQAGTIAPFGIQFDSVGRISHHQSRLALAEKSSNSFGTGGVSTEHSVRTKQPQIAGAGHGRFGKRRRRIGVLLVIQRKQIVDLAWVESRQ